MALVAAVALAAAIGSATSVYTVVQVAGLRSGSRETEQLRTGGMGIGLFPGAEYRQASVELNADELLVVTI
jgi:hypothetical protein